MTNRPRTPTPTPRAALRPQHFRARRSEFTSPAQRRTIDELATWIRSAFAADLRARPSRHVYVSSLPSVMVAKIDALRDAAEIREAIRSAFGRPVTLMPMKSTDELYLSHYNHDLGGDHGLFARHYDGNLRHLPWGTVVRALIYLRSSGTYRVVFEDSRLSHRFVTYEFGLLDFHRELHHVEGEYAPGAEERLVLKCNTLVVSRGQEWVGRMLLAANLGQFYVVKAAMEYSKSPTTPAQRLVGVLCNVFRVANNVHPLIPMALVVLAAAAPVAVFLELARLVTGSTHG